MPIDDRTVNLLKRRVGPGAVRFIEYLCGEFRVKAWRSAVDQGFTSAEAEEIAGVTMVAAAKAMASASVAAHQARAFKSPH